MTTLNKSLIGFLLSLLFISCATPDDDYKKSDEQQPVTEEGAYADECKWIYQQMNHYYLWRSDMPDSVDCDYATDPVSFFKSLLSPKDRFSYCEHNPAYSGASEVIKDDGDGITLRNTRSTDSNVFLDSVYLVNGTSVGYFCYMQFESYSELEPTLKKFKESNITELIVDLRYNPGGYIEVCRYLCNAIVNECGYEKVFQYLTYNDIVTKELIAKTGKDKDSALFKRPDTNSVTIGTALYGLNLKRVFVLTSNGTASASEALIKCLQPYMETVIIGEQTVGKGVGSFTLRETKYLYELHPITFRYYNANMETTPDTGITPDIDIANGYSTPKKEIGNTDEPMLHQALSVIGK